LTKNQNCNFANEIFLEKYLLSKKDIDIIKEMLSFLFPFDLPSTDQN